MCRLPALAALLTAALLVAGCSDGRVVHVRGDVVSLTTTDYRIKPQTVRVAPGRVTFRVVNRGRVPHNWDLKLRGGRRAHVSTLLPGEGGSVTVRLRRGAYAMSSTVGHDEELGQYGTVVVR